MAWVDPRTWLAGEKLTAAKLNEVRDSLKAIGDAWTAYTPTWTGTGFSIGNGGATGAYIQAGKFVIFRFTLTVGSTTTVGSAAYSFGLPFTSAVTDIWTGGVEVRDSSVPAVRLRQMYINTSSTCAAQDDSGAFVTGAAPFALATNDTLKGFGSFQST